MNQEQEQPRHRGNRDRSKVKGWSKFHRYRVLLMKKWWILLLGVILGLAAGWTVSHFGPPAFTSVGRMMVSIKLSIQEGSVYSEEMNSFMGTQTALMQSDAVTSRARARLAAEHPEMPAVPLKLSVNVVPRTSIFVLQATGEEPKYTEAYLQACMEEYINVKKEMRMQTSDSTVAGLTEEVVRLERELRTADEELAAFQATNGVIISQEQAAGAANYLTALNQRLAALKSEYELLQSLTLDQNLQRKPPASEPGPLAPSSSGSGLSENANVGATDRQDSEYLQAKQQIALLKADREELGRFLRPRHPKMIAMSEEIARRERLLGIYRQQSAEQLEGKKASMVLQIANLEKDIREWDTKTLDTNRKAAEFTRLKTNSQRIQALYDRLLATMQTLDVNKQVNPESVTIMERASGAWPDKPRLSKQMQTGALAGLAISLALLFFIDRLDDRMHSFTEVQEMFDEEILGQIPREKTGSTQREAGLIQPDDDRHSFVEAYRNLRSSLLYMAEAGERPKTLLVTSSVPNDGKSLTSANLAITLATSGSTVLLVDADLRKGGLHHRFGLEDEPGLSEVLSEGRKWEEAVKPTRFANLSLLPRGKTTQRSSEFFISEETKRFLEAVAEKFDFVVIDTAPVMAADDVTSLAPHMDGVLFVLRAEQTSARVARAALDLLYQRQVNVLGLVFNAVRPSSGDYYYYYKYDDYYSSYPASKSRRGSKREKAERA